MNNKEQDNGQKEILTKEQRIAAAIILLKNKNHITYENIEKALEHLTILDESFKASDQSNVVHLKSEGDALLERIKSPIIDDNNPVLIVHGVQLWQHGRIQGTQLYSNQAKQKRRAEWLSSEAEKREQPYTFKQINFPVY